MLESTSPLHKLCFHFWPSNLHKQNGCQLHNVGHFQAIVRACILINTKQVCWIQLALFKSCVSMFDHLISINKMAAKTQFWWLTWCRHSCVNSFQTSWMPIHASRLIVRLMLACTHWCASQSWLLAFAATSLALFPTWACDHLETTVWYRTQCHQYGLQFWIHKSPSHFWGRRELRCGAVGISPYHRLIMDSLQVQTECITCWGHCFWFPSLGKQQVPCCIDRVGVVHIVYSTDKSFWRLNGVICQFANAHVLKQAMVFLEYLPRWPLCVICDVGCGVAPSQCVEC